MADADVKSDSQEAGEAAVDVFRQELGPFVVAAEKTRMPMVFTDEKPGHPIVFANDAFLELTGCRRDEVLAKSFGSLLAVDVSAETLALVDAAFRGAGGSEPEVHYRRKDGSLSWASIFVSPVCVESGEVVQQFVSLVDLTRHRDDNARCKMLIDELNHRVKNTLSTVQSIVAQALRQPAAPAAIREAIESRILALSRSHDLLTGGHWKGAGLHDLVHTAMQPFAAVAGRAERFTIRGDDIQLTPKITLSLAIALHELATNAVKYGAFSTDEGTIEIDWTVTPLDDGNELELRWREQGGPPVTPPTRRGFGSWVLERGLPHELGGQVTLNYQPGGVVCQMTIPVPGGASA